MGISQLLLATCQNIGAAGLTITFLTHWATCETYQPKHSDIHGRFY